MFAVECFGWFLTNLFSVIIDFLSVGLDSKHLPHIQHLKAIAITAQRNTLGFLSMSKANSDSRTLPDEVLQDAIHSTIT